MKILIADDEPNMRRLIERTLVGLGHEVVGMVGTASWGPVVDCKKSSARSQNGTLQAVNRRHGSAWHRIEVDSRSS